MLTYYGFNDTAYKIYPEIALDQLFFSKKFFLKNGTVVKNQENFKTVFDDIIKRALAHVVITFGSLKNPLNSKPLGIVTPEQIAAAEALLENSFANGSGGFKEFGAGTPAILHGNEAVVPRNSSAGQMLASSGLSSTPGTASGTYNNTASSGILDGLNRLNTTMRSVESLLQQGNTIQKRTQRNTAGLGNDMFVGVPT